MFRRLRSNAGQTTAEYMGALLIVAAIIGVFALTDIGAGPGPVDALRIAARRADHDPLA